MVQSIATSRHGTRNFLHEPAMSRGQAIAALENGIELARDAAARFDIAGIGEMGIGNSTSASALLCAFTGASPQEAAAAARGWTTTASSTSNKS